jgi:hexokinase
VRDRLQKSWPIEEQLKNNKAEDLFDWIGARIAEVVLDGMELWPENIPDHISLATEDLPDGHPLLSSKEIPVGVTFSFPMRLVQFQYMRSR